jgi:hypothetical protein
MTPPAHHQVWPDPGGLVDSRKRSVEGPTPESSLVIGQMKLLERSGADWLGERFETWIRSRVGIDARLGPVRSAGDYVTQY